MGFLTFHGQKLIAPLSRDGQADTRVFGFLGEAFKCRFLPVRQLTLELLGAGIIHLIVERQRQGLGQLDDELLDIFLKFDTRA